MRTLTPARDRLRAFYAAHPDVENADGEQLLALPPALLAELDALLAAAGTEKAGPLVIDPATGVRELRPTFPGGMADGVRVFTTGRNARGRFASFDAIRVTVTARGHWYRLGDVPDGLHNDTVCRGCGHHGHFNYIPDYRLCTAPATAEDVVAALAGPARHVQPGDRVRLVVSEYPDPVVGTIRRIYRNAISQEVAEIDLPGGRDFLQGLEFLTPVL
jgi:hypothetical protein